MSVVEEIVVVSLLGGEDEGLFFEDTVAAYLANPRFVRRDWLSGEVAGCLGDDSKPFVLLTAEPGFGKTAFMAQLAEDNPLWPRYFIRRDQREPLADVSARSLLLRIGYQLAARYPEVFERDALQFAVEQRIGVVHDGGEAVGAEIDKITASPFYKGVVRVRQHVDEVSGSVVGLHVGQLQIEPRAIDPSDLQHMALLDPARALQRLHAKQQVVVLIDALDEVRYHNTTDDLLTWLINCPQLPPNVRFVLTARPPDGAVRHLLSKQSRRTRHVVLDNRSGKQIRAEVANDIDVYVGNLLGDSRLRAQLENRPDGVGSFRLKATAKADGNLGYLDALARGIDHALAGEDTQTLAELLALEALPNDIQGLYAFFLHQIKQSVARQRIELQDSTSGETYDKPVWSAVHYRILGVLAVALEPVSLEQIQRLGGITADWNDVTAAADSFAPFLDLIDGRYRLYHATLPEFLTDSNTKTAPNTQDLYVDAVQWHARIAKHYVDASSSKSMTDLNYNDGYWTDVGASPERVAQHSRSRSRDNWIPVIPDRYALAHLAAHMAGARDLRGLYRLITRPWMIAKLIISGSHWAFAQDATLAMQAARGEEPPNLRQLTRATLILETVSVVATATSPQVLELLADAGQPEAVIQHAELVSDSEQRDVLYLRACEAAADHGDIEMATAVAKRIGLQWWRTLAQSAICAAAGDERSADALIVDAILSTVGEIQSTRVEVLRHVGYVLARSGRLTLLTRLIDAEDSLPTKGYESTEMVKSAVDELVLREDSVGLRNLIDVAADLADEYVAAEILRATAPHLSLVREFAVIAKAVRTAVHIGDETARSETLRALSCSLPPPAGRTNLDKIASAVERSTSAWQKILLLDAVARLSTRLNDHGKDQWISSQTEDVIAAVSAETFPSRADDIKAAMQYVATLANAAEILALVGQRDRPKDIVNNALRAAHRTRLDPAALTTAVKVVARAGDADNALALVWMGATDAHQALLLSIVADALAVAGDHDRAADTAEQAAALAQVVDEPSDRAYLLSCVVHVMASVNEVERSKAVLNDIDAALADATDSTARAEIIARIGLPWLSAGDHIRSERALREAVDAAHAINDTTLQVPLLAALSSVAVANEVDHNDALDPAHIFRRARTARVDAPTLAATAVDVARAGAVEYAMMLVSTINDDRWKADASIDVLKSTHAHGWDITRNVIELARAMASKIRGTGRRAKLLHQLAIVVACRRDYDEAEEIARTNDNAVVVPQSLAVIASIAARNGDRPRARKAAALASDALYSVTDGGARTNTLGHLARCMNALGDRSVAMGLAQQALDAVPMAETPDQWEIMYASDSLGWLDSSSYLWTEFGLSRQAADKALTVVREVPLNSRVAHCLAAAARAWALLGRYSGAPNLEATLHEAGSQTEELYKPLAQAGRYDEALDLAEHMGSAWRAAREVGQELLRPQVNTDVPSLVQRIIGLDESVLALAGRALAAVAPDGEAIAIADRALEQLRTDASRRSVEDALPHVLATYARIGILKDRIDILLPLMDSLDNEARTTAGTIIAESLLIRNEVSSAALTLERLVTPLWAIYDDRECYAQAESLSSLSVAASGLGLKPLAVELANEAFTAASAIDSYWHEASGVVDKEGALTNAFKAQARANTVVPTIESVTGIESSLRKLELLWDACQWAPDANRSLGTIAQAAEQVVAEHHKRNIRTAFLRCGAAKVMAKAGETDRVQRIVDSVVDWESHFRNAANKAFVWSLAAEALIIAGDQSLALEVVGSAVASAHEHGHTEERLFAFLALVNALTTLGEPIRAADLVEEALGTWSSAKLSGDEASARLYFGSVSAFNDLVGSGYAASRLGDATTSIWSCGALAFAMAGKGSNANDAAEKARAAADVVGDPTRVPSALATVARAMAAVNRDDEAVQLVNNALIRAQGIGRSAVFDVLRLSALALLEAGARETVQDVGEAVLDVSDWWPLARRGGSSGLYKTRISAGGDEPFE